MQTRTAEAALLLILAVLATSCTVDTGGSERSSGIDANSHTSITESTGADSESPHTGDTDLPVDVLSSLGQDLDSFTANVGSMGYQVRVVRQDGKDLDGTADFVGNRLNVAVEDGLVVEIFRLG